MMASSSSSFSLSPSSVRELKEAFVTGHDGTTPWEVLLVCLPVITGSALYMQIAPFVLMEAGVVAAYGDGDRCATKGDTTAKTDNYRIWRLVILEAIVLWFPLVLAQTNYLYPWGVVVMVGQAIAAVALLTWRRKRQRELQRQVQQPQQQQSQSLPGHQQASTPSSSVGNNNNDRPSQRDYLTLYRSSLMYLTFVAILAVDFPLFPRRFCKTETIGYGLMDVGAASFCISAGLVAGNRQRQRRYRQGTKKAGHHHLRSSSLSLSSLMLLLKPILRAAPLVIIGLIRIVTNKELDYQEHVSEYGVHWNFFFTLGVLAVVPATITILMEGIVHNLGRRHRDRQQQQEQQPPTQQWEPTWILPAIVMTVYQLMLSYGQWQHFIETAPRTLQALHQQHYHQFQDHQRQQEQLDNEPNGVHTSAFYPTHGLAASIVRLCPQASCSSLSWAAPVLLNFFIANREGILGCIGYLSLYYWGQWIGYHYLSKERELNNSNNSSTNNGTINNNNGLGRCAILLWTVHGVLSTVLGLPVSRRSTNLNFCVWALAHNILLLYGLQMVASFATVPTTTHPTTLSDRPSSPCTTVEMVIIPPGWAAVNRHGLLMFLIANLLTGLVNLTIPTLDVTDPYALVIVFGYIGTVGMIALLLDVALPKMVTKAGTEDHNHDTTKPGMPTVVGSRTKKNKKE